MFEAFRRGTPAEVWQALVLEAAERAGHPLDEAQESHLVFVLLRYQNYAALLSHVHGVDWMEALSRVGSARADALRDVGDRCLLVAGLFPGLAERRRVTVDYFIDIGRSAYHGVAGATRQAYAALYEQLARSYRELVATLNAMRMLSKMPEGMRVVQ
ncbi:hypothetical protein [Fulvimonas soli]|jgi:hypothetical protein|uniref:Uncharacterized protein n=1 Tax=Fulvimonas soli TaxID=155197 RepID=A0A316IKN4_9GAMM|nr:hypothetical protein [Fulvimonas soli]PWK87752.1 hypothetical protein C7456_106245 [Fulvimonas soli]TNY26535.1 hypothetical protein BV497_08310 [Fulvimonas soli]